MASLTFSANFPKEHNLANIAFDKRNFVSKWKKIPSICNNFQTHCINLLRRQTYKLHQTFNFSTSLLPYNHPFQTSHEKLMKKCASSLNVDYWLHTFVWKISFEFNFKYFLVFSFTRSNILTSLHFLSQNVLFSRSNLFSRWQGQSVSRQQ